MEEEENQRLCTTKRTQSPEALALPYPGSSTRGVRWGPLGSGPQVLSVGCRPRNPSSARPWYHASCLRPWPPPGPTPHAASSSFKPTPEQRSLNPLHSLPRSSPPTASSGLPLALVKTQKTPTIQCRQSRQPQGTPSRHPQEPSPEPSHHQTCGQLLTRLQTHNGARRGDLPRQHEVFPSTQASWQAAGAAPAPARAAGGWATSTAPSTAAPRPQRERVQCKRWITESQNVRGWQGPL